MIKQDAWIAFIFFVLVIAACFPTGHPDVPDKADVIPPRPTPQPTPDKSPCDFEVDSLKDENERLREMLRESNDTTYVQGDDDANQGSGDM